MSDVDEDMGSEIMGSDEEGVEQISGESVLRLFVSEVVKKCQRRSLIREEFEAAFSMAQVAQDKYMSRLTKVEPSEIQRRYPAFWEQVTSEYMTEDPEDFKDSAWMLMRNDFQSIEPYVVLPDGDIRILRWNAKTGKAETTDNDELDRILYSYVDGSNIS